MGRHLVASQNSTVPPNWLTRISRGSRCSLCLSIARIFPEKSICRRFSFGLAITFFLSYIVALLTSGLACKPVGGAWYDTAFICFKQPVGHIISWLFVVVLGLCADILLVSTPIAMLWKVRLPKKERRLILVLFASSVVSLLSAISFELVWFFVTDHGVGTYTVGLMFTLLQVSHPKILSFMRRCAYSTSFGF